MHFGKLFIPLLGIGYSGGPQKTNSRGVPSKDKCLGQENNMKANRTKALSQASSFILSMGKVSGLFKKQVKLLTFQFRLLRGTGDVEHWRAITPMQKADATEGYIKGLELTKAEEREELQEYSKFNIF